MRYRNIPRYVVDSFVRERIDGVFHLIADASSLGVPPGHVPYGTTQSCDYESHFCEVINHRTNNVVRFYFDCFDRDPSAGVWVGRPCENDVKQYGPMQLAIFNT